MLESKEVVCPSVEAPRTHLYHLLGMYLNKNEETFVTYK
jgi:hypothetical protein